MGTDETRVGENVSVGKKKIRHSVIDEINAAFSDLPYPGDPLLVCEPIWSDGEVTVAFKGRHRLDLEVMTLRANREALRFFKPALRFYLPAFMIAALQEPKRADVLPDEVCSTLNPPRTAISGVMAVFDAKQKGAIQAFPAYARDYLGIAEARHALYRFGGR